MVEIERWIAKSRRCACWCHGLVLRALAHYTVHGSRTGWRSPAVHPPTIQIHQSIRFPTRFWNISTWKASSGGNLKTNFTKTRWCCKTAGGLLPLTRLSHDSEILSCGLPSWRLSRNVEWTQKIDREGHLLGLSRRLMTENITSKLSENVLLRQDPSTDELGRHTDWFFREGSRSWKKSVLKFSAFSLFHFFPGNDDWDKKSHPYIVHR